MLSGELGELSKQPATELLVRKARLTQLQAPPLPESRRREPRSVYLLLGHRGGACGNWAEPGWPSGACGF